MHLDERYARNMNMLTLDENKYIQQSCVAVIGCGGLGGGIIEMLARIGVGKIIAVDGDVFDKTNLNRQLLSHSLTIGEKKAKAAQERVALVNPDVEVIAITERIDENNAESILEDAQILIDATDRIQTRLMLQNVAEKRQIPMVHGAIAGWYGQVVTILPGDRTLDRVYSNAEQNQGVEKQMGNPSFTPAMIGSIQVSETIKLLIQRGEILRNKMLYIDLLEQEYHILKMS
ncbi:HesA/MoeB/ThiF family protein [Tindallia californiensis]|uniref:Molybdopterin or thiamine biosynthesis adenylyltransferase n=1 Tax=Tindallia californiensis TaxID=159292 RepID=A0A1H3MNK5_9FIRM|nr:HesA/MoeB/ThiF family protein [Tindallia californiensis]SDY78166.1 Molybdopterin or thiamine biosynthesis adenylyltransferase [Tindallia californiensis]